MLIQRFGAAANLDIHLHCRVLDEVYGLDTEADGVSQALEHLDRHHATPEVFAGVLAALGSPGVEVALSLP